MTRSVNVLSPATALGLLVQLEQRYSLPGFITTDALMEFWGVTASTVCRRLAAMEVHGHAYVRSTSPKGYWIDPIVRRHPDLED